MLDAVREILERDPRIAFAMLFGSGARGELGPHSDWDVAVGLVPGASLDATELGALVARLEAAASRPVDVVLLDEAGPALAYRVFRDGRPLAVRDPQRLATRKAEAILEYLDFQPFEKIFSRGVLEAARRGR